MKILKNISNIFFRPVRVFKQNINTHEWLIIFIIIIFISLVTSYLIIPRLIIPDHINRVYSNTKNQELKNANLAYLNSSYHYISALLSIAFPKIVYYPILAFFLSMVPLVFGGKTISYIKIFPPVIYTGLINSSGFLLDSILKIKLNTLDVGLNMALLYNSSNLFVNSFLNVVNLFGLWQIILLTILISILFNYSKTKSFFIIFLSWFVIKLISAYYFYLTLIIN